MRYRRTVLVGASLATFAVGACGTGDETSDAQPTTPSSSAPTIDADNVGIRLVSPDDAAQTITDAPDDLVILDVRTSEEFAEGHIDGAVMIDFYRDDFAEQIAGLDPEVPYLVYCRSGNRSGQTRELMADLGFESVDDVDGGIVAWQAAGLPVTTE